MAHRGEMCILNCHLDGAGDGIMSGSDGKTSFAVSLIDLRDASQVEHTGRVGNGSEGETSGIGTHR